MPNLPGVMVSSTCYDLGEVRAELRRFVEEELGYRALLSEYPSFPVDPEATTIENCRKTVREDADVLVLLIGARYGSLDPTSSKSITNLEYLTARAKGIPIYVFLARDLHPLLRLWESDPTRDYSSVVDNPKLFEFIKEIRSEHSRWVFPFERARDIVATLRQQVAYLVRDALSTSQRARRHPDQDVLNQLGPVAFKLAIERPAAWEVRLFGQMLSDEVALLGEKRSAFTMGVSLGPSSYVPEDEVFGWIRAKTRDLARQLEDMQRLTQVPIETIFGAPGEGTNVRQVLYYTRQIARFYEGLLDWSKSMRQTSFDHELGRRIAREAALLVEPTLRMIEEKGPETVKKANESLMPSSEARRASFLLSPSR